MRERGATPATAAFVFFALLLFFCFPLPANAVESQDAIVKVPQVSTLYGNERDDELLYGMFVNITGEQNGLYKVTTQYNYDTLVSPDYLAVDTAAAETWKNSVTHCVIAPFADVVPQPDTQSYPPILTLPRGSLLKVTGESGDYSTVQLFDGTIGYVRTPSLRKLRTWGQLDENTTRTDVIRDALSYLGTAYRWGGKTPEGIDCSGLASMSWMLNGLDIYRNASPKAGYPVALKDVEGTSDDRYTMETLQGAKPGDLLYWEGHEGVYLGEGRYVHSNGLSFNTRINSLIAGDPFYRDDLAHPSAVYAWGTAFPAEPDKLIVRRLIATPITSGDEKGWYRFYAKVDGYTPNRAILYPEGAASSDISISVDNPANMLYGGPDSTSSSIPTWRYTAPGTYAPAIVFINDTGWRPEGKTISSDVFTTTQPITISGDTPSKGGSGSGCNQAGIWGLWSVLPALGLFFLVRRRDEHNSSL